MIKNVILILFLVLSAGAWFYLDHTNKEDQMETMQMRISMEHTRADGEGKARAQLESKLRIALMGCQTNAEKARVDFLTQNQKPVRGKPKEVTLARNILDQAETTLVNATATCWSDYSEHMAKGS